MRYVILDTETTGLDPLKGHKITEIGCLEMVSRKLTGRTFHTYLNPERDLDIRAQEITGLTREFLKDKPKFIEIAEVLVHFIDGAELIIHNAPFDLGFLNNELRLIKHYFAPLQSRLAVTDTLQMARKRFPGQKNDLDTLCRRFSIDNSSRKYHGALLDAEILTQVYIAMTAGQTSFLTSLHQSTEESNRRGKARAPYKRLGADFAVYKASDEEMAAHLQQLARLQKTSKGECLWQQMMDAEQEKQ